MDEAYDGPPVDGVGDRAPHLEFGENRVAHVEADVGEVRAQALSNLEPLVLDEARQNIGRKSVLEEIDPSAFEFQDADGLLRQNPEDEALEGGFAAEMAGERLECDSLVRREFHELERAGADGFSGESAPRLACAFGENADHEGLRERGGGFFEMKDDAVRRGRFDAREFIESRRPGGGERRVANGVESVFHVGRGEGFTVMEPHPAFEFEAVDEGRGPLPFLGEFQDDAALVVIRYQAAEDEALHLGGDGVLRQPRVELRGVGSDADDDGVVFWGTLLPAAG